MTRKTTRLAVFAASIASAVVLAAPSTPLGADSGQERPTGQGFAFRTGVDLISVPATVTDENGRFVSNLRKEDFVVLEDGKPQEISQFDSERVPVSLGIALDTSGSMLGEKLAAAQAALNRFLVDLLGPQDEVFVYRFDIKPYLLQPWTTDRIAAGRALGQVQARGGTAIYDTVAEALPLAQRGTRRKKALVLISDGNDTSSSMALPELHRMIREAEVLVYAIGIDASGKSGGSYSSPTSTSGSSGSSSGGVKTIPVPSAFPGQKQPATKTVPAPANPPPSSPGSTTRRMPGNNAGSDRVNADALRDITDDSGGRTEIIYSQRDLDPTTAGIADELSRQYFIGYTSSAPKDGKWHTIEVQVRRGNYVVRARKGFISG